MLNLLWLTTSLMTCFVIKISLYGAESDAKSVTKKGKRGQKVMRCVIDFPTGRVQATRGISYRRHKEFISQRHNGPIYATQLELDDEGGPLSPFCFRSLLSTFDL